MEQGNNSETHFLLIRPTSNGDARKWAAALCSAPPVACLHRLDRQTKHLYPFCFIYVYTSQPSNAPDALTGMM